MWCHLIPESLTITLQNIIYPLDYSPIPYKFISNINLKKLLSNLPLIETTSCHPNVACAFSPSFKDEVFFISDLLLLRL